VAQKYFRGKLGAPEREHSVRQMIGRVADTITAWGRKDSYFADAEEADAFHAELVHLLLYQTGSAHSSPVDAATQLFAGRVDVWIEARAHGLLGTEGLAGVLERAPRSGPERRLGMVFGDNSTLLRSMEDPLALIESEATWEDDVADACRHALGVVPAANICVYREADLQELGLRLDPLAAALKLIQTHPHVAIQEPEGRVTTGPAAVERILTAVRPSGVSSGTWESLARAAAAGLAHA
jgi:hypothetical protein